MFNKLMQISNFWPHNLGSESKVPTLTKKHIKFETEPLQPTASKLQTAELSYDDFSWNLKTFRNFNLAAYKKMQRGSKLYAKNNSGMGNLNLFKDDHTGLFLVVKTCR